VANKKRYDVCGIGNAIVDTLAQVDDSLVQGLGLTKGSMSLMETPDQARVLSKLDHRNLQLASGGSAANTMVAVTQSGGTGVYFGKVAHDTNGEFYKQDMERNGVQFPVPLTPEAGLPTGTCVVLTTPDAERTMCTHLGISTALSKSDLNLDILSQSQVCYIEGYLWDAEQPRGACQEAFIQSNRLGIKTAFTFSDSFLIHRFADDFSRLVKEHCDILFCNSDEAYAFFETQDLHECCDRVAELCDVAFITRSGEGCYVVDHGQVIAVAGFPVKAIDTVGAGDAFAGGTLFGLTNGMSATQSAKWGNYFASRVVEQIGPRLDDGAMSRHVKSVVG
jgi:sugar/nucleoside kinase (ribokinase family)